ncbi:uncharacterized protein MELLADRAFT_109270 [Melampsora larici-populina 98AG31]|uniref:Uncharacterized protein n=1 Tax=Melampsora larici-populina (strain 98AG31 / pathotype 3-4-7) TaxID=747676 RepID=F4RVX9_MELLP|nr:uncharacterized protein MELLADRAFT_109270 [Melampsora larici-populina 98AG31]EGG03507.1 hypothetical protein MELLADRAFT_109270 [Melampsora larici-populina 98AG31]
MFLQPAFLTIPPVRTRTRRMTRNYYLSFCLILMLLPLLESLPYNEPLLNLSYKKLAELDNDNPEALLLGTSFTDFQEGKQRANQGRLWSILDTTKSALKEFFNPQSKTPGNKALTSWEVCYGISAKAIGSSDSPTVKDMANAVLELGPRFHLHQYNPQVDLEHVKSTLKLHYNSLESDALSTAERIWSVGVLSYLRSRIPKDRHSAIPLVWTANDLIRPRGDFLLFFLQDEDLGKIAEEMWAESPFKSEPFEHIIQEVIQRESIVHHIKDQIGTAPDPPSKDFQTLYLAFINLETPIDSEKASSLMILIKNHLEHLNRKKRNHFDEEANTIRILLHLEEHHYDSSVEFRRLTKSPTILAKVLQSDISFQIAGTLPPRLSSFLRELLNTNTVNIHHITQVLEILKHEQISTPQLGRLFRVLNLVFKRDRAMYRVFSIRLDEYTELIPKLSEMLLKYRHGRMKTQGFAWGTVEYFVLNKNTDQLAEKYRNLPRNALVSNSERETARDFKNSRGLSRERVVDSACPVGYVSGWSLRWLNYQRICQLE